ncbi:dTDP-glucose 4,6-dehydratase [Phytoactinopolyspora mesophila]|uniref:dTDP-glucose 4,6-dehydratase n=1 Tax=Phytoactinopolyspora mesophila TaxID=2650750 RepID=A0A7K3M0T4_9ACTN|nr:dTDP-glucose 4,6-dehydratase [Phytoactinopolyspora mesophila]NDL56889.1 dTDP-glucose 4,6-dehydratase [Phytoactinopolyspora mesophila]
MRIFVAGGAGFVGSHFVRQLLADAYPALGRAHVLVLDKLTYAGNLANLEAVADHPRLDFVQGDVCDSALVTSLMRDVALTVNFAAETHVDRSIHDAEAFVRTNVLGAQTLFRCAVEAGVRRLVHISTDEVYGSIEVGSWPEDHQLAPNSPYAASKAAADMLALAYHRTHGLDVRVTRCSNNYGPYQYPEKIIPLFVSNLLDGLTVPLYGDGRNLRDWVHVDDHCRAIALVADRGRAGHIYNVGGGTELSNVDLVEHLLGLLGRDWSAVRRVADRPGHDRRYSVDTKKIAALGFHPHVDFREGLAATVRWYRENRAWWEPLKALVQREPAPLHF